jgi:hypothetical protein
VVQSKAVTVLSSDTRWCIIHTDPSTVTIRTYDGGDTVLAVQRFPNSIFLEFAEAIALVATVVRRRSGAN